MVEGSVALDEPAERARILFPAPIAPGAWRLRLRFTGILNDRLHGFYRSSYKDAAGAAHTIAATQFEATDARRAFPCWDEPAAKAVFGVTLVVPEGLAAISNTAVVSEAPAGPGRRAVTFADSIRMSTYLVAFVVGELEATPPVMVGKTPLRIWCVPGKTHLARVAQQIGAFSLEFFEQYYGLPYPGDKLDLLAIPDFAAGAMENLGAVTFRETALLVDEAAASHTEIERVADVVAHEVAHMWFGDLVTMLWWNGIWLNEAFATFMELLAVDAWKPEWKRWVTFGVSRAAAMGVDGLVNTRPIEFEVKAPKDCEAMFDLLTYEKGASVLRMLEQHIGPEVFRDGVRLYLERHQFGNAETTDLWKALGDASRQPIPEVMDGWIFHPGYPLVRVEADGQGLRLSQRRFTYLGEDAAGRWRIPIVLRAWVKRGIIEKHVLLDGDDLVVPLPAAPDWAIVNAGGHGFYRVSYAPPLLKKLSGALPRLSPIERFNLVSDSFALAQSGAMSAAEYLELSARFTEETDRNVWAAITGSFAYLNRVIAPEHRSGLEALVRHRLTAAVERLGWEAEPEESELLRQLRADLLRAMGVLGNDPVTQERARELYARQRTGERGGGCQRAARPHRHRGGERGRGGVRGVLGALPRCAHAPGGAAVSLRLGRLSPPRSRAADARPYDRRRGAEPGRAVPHAHAARQRARARAGLGVPQGALGDDGAHVSGQRVSAHVRGHHRAREPRVGARGPGILHVARHRPRRQDARAIPRAAPGGRAVPGAGVGGARDVPQSAAALTARSAEASAHPASLGRRVPRAPAPTLTLLDSARSLAALRPARPRPVRPRSNRVSPQRQTSRVDARERTDEPRGTALAHTASGG